MSISLAIAPDAESLDVPAPARWGGAFAVIRSLSIPALAGTMNRKTLLLALTGIMGISGAIVALAPNYATYMIGRALIGVVIGAFFMGPFTLFTYVRPFLETVTRVDVSTLSSILLGIGVAGFIGTA